MNYMVNMFNFYIVKSRRQYSHEYITYIIYNTKIHIGRIILGYIERSNDAAH
jgi:hypothetical protein